MISVMITLLLTVSTAVPAFADGPVEDVVIEGVSVPCVALGETRAQIVATVTLPGCGGKRRPGLV